MIVCKVCKFDNPPGLAFCQMCGKKLDLSSLMPPEMAARKRVQRTVRLIVKSVVSAVCAVVIILAGLSFIPAREPIGEAGTVAQAHQAASALRGLAKNSPGQSLGTTLSESQVNAFFEFMNPEPLQVDRVSVQIGESRISFRVTDSFRVGSSRFAFRISYEFFCLPVAGGLRVEKVKQGRLALHGPLKTRVVTKFYERLQSCEEWPVLQRLTEIRVRSGGVHLVIDR